MGLMGLLLAVVGLYGLIAYSVSRRTREIGIRMAIGADQRNVLRMVLRQGFTLAVAGIAAGIVLGIFAARLVGSLTLSSFGHISALIFIAISAPLLIIALLATYAPARRASLIDPMRALRDE